MAWFVVHFKEDNTVEVVPTNWMVEDKECFFPPYRRAKLYDAIKNRDSPESDWKIFKIKILGQYDDFHVAQRKCNRARDNDKLSSNSEPYSESLGKGLRTRVSRKFEDFDIISNSDEGCDDDHINMPSVPLQLKKKTINIKQITDLNPASKNLGCENNKEIVVKLNNLESLLKTFINENQEFQRQVLRQLIIINTRVTEYAENSEIIMKAINKTSEESREVNNEQHRQEIMQKMKKFPINSEDNLMEIERVLQDSDEMEILAKELSLIGGDTVKDITKRVMFQILSNNMGSLYSWEGAKGKKKFKAMKMAKLVMRAVRLNKTTKEATETEIIKHIKEWLVRAEAAEKKAGQTRDEGDETEISSNEFNFVDA